MAITFFFFSSDLNYRTIFLFGSHEIAEHSFVVQNSLSPLDLEVRRTTTGLCFGISLHRMINTQEKCRKWYSSSRSLLYNLHLDLPTGREVSLKSESLPSYLNFRYNSDSVGKIEIYDRFYVDSTCGFLDYAYKSGIDPYRFDHILKWFVELEELKHLQRISIPRHLLKLFVDRMYAEPADTEFIDRCFKVFDFTVLMADDVTAETVGRLLYVVRLNSNRIDIKYWVCQFSDCCFLTPTFQFVGEVLKFLSAPHLFLDRVLDCYSTMGYSLALPVYSLLRSLKGNKKRRFALLLHLYWTYSNRSISSSDGASESLLLFWRATPDPFLNSTEITAAFEWMRSEITDGIYKFYSEAVVENKDYFETRSLQHLCRTVIRARLWENGRWLPEGIENVGLPTMLQLYLKLEK